MGIDQPTVGAVEQGGGQAAGADFGAHPGAAVEQDVVEIQADGSEVALHRACVFALVDKDEVRPGLVFLRGGEHRQFAPAGWTPGGPQIDHDGSAGGEFGELCRLARKRRQWRPGQGGIAHQVYRAEHPAPDQGA